MQLTTYCDVEQEPAEKVLDTVPEVIGGVDVVVQIFPEGLNGGAANGYANNVGAFTDKLGGEEAEVGGRDCRINLKMFSPAGISHLRINIKAHSPGPKTRPMRALSMAS